MQTSKHILLTVVLVLLSGLGTSAIAQRKAGASIRLPPEPIGTVVSVNAIEVTDGFTGFDSEKQETQFGYSFLGRTTGTFPGSFTMTMNCSPAVAIPGETSYLKSGSWTLPVYTAVRNGSSYAGAFYGTIAKGQMTYDKTATNANVYIVLNVDGGTQTWKGTKGYATFTGTLLVDDKTQETTLTGTLVFNLIDVDPIQ